MVGEKLRDLQLILMALNSLDLEYKSFTASLTMRIDHTMSFPNLQQLLMDKERSIGTTTLLVEVNDVSISSKSNSAKGIPC